MANKSDANPGAGKRQRRQRISSATDTLALLDQQAKVVRAELVGLQQNLADVQLRLVGARTNELREANEQLALAAMHAESIGTPNRALLLDRLENAIAIAQRRRTHIAVLFLDLDDCKQINDTLGHAIGDVVVRLVVRRVESVVRRCDIVSRHGGDELLVLMAEINDPADAALIARKILTVLAGPSRIDNHLISLSASLGIALFPEDADDAATLIARADAAMKRCKEQGGGHFQCHSDPVTPGRGPLPSQWVSRDEVLPDEQSAAMDNLREANQQLVMAILTAQELEEQVQLKHARQVKFMAMVAHELRNPLTPIRTAAGLLKRVHATNLAGDVQVLIEEQVVRMSRLVEDLLDSTRVSAGTFRIEWSNVQLARILERTVATCRPEMAARHQRLTLHIPSGAPDMLGDPMRLTQIFCNLLDNASKYTHDGGEIAVTVEPSDDAVGVRVSDNGMGIAPTALTSIFDLYVQDERALTICRGGLGIGLAVVRDLVEAHGGTITAHSSGENLGSEFVVTLPIRGPGERRRGEQGNRSP